MHTETYEGGCQCGQVRFKTSDRPVRVIACHCSTCRRRTGSPFGVGVYFRDQDIEFVRGSLRTFEFRSSESGRWLRNEFCGTCGATVTWTLEMRPGLRAVAGGCFDDPDWYDVNAHIWTESARRDMRYPEDMPVYQKAMPLTT